MSRQNYKRTTFEEDETSNGDLSPTSDSGGTADTSVVFRITTSFWKSRTFMEKICLPLLVILILILIIIASLLGVKHVEVHMIKQNITQNVSQTGNYCAKPACITVAASIINSLDVGVDPCDDFYQYACGGWIKDHPMPPGHSRWGTFGVLWKENQLVLKNAVEKPLESFNSTAEKKARSYYMSCMDENGEIEKLGSQPMIKLISSVGGWNISRSSGDWSVEDFDLQQSMETMGLHDISPLFSWGISIDDRNSSTNIIAIDQGGLELSRHDYMVNSTIQNDTNLNAYLTYMTTVGQLLGGDYNATYQQVLDVIEFERKLANITVPKDQRRDIETLYNKMTIEELQQKAPVFNWLQLLNSIVNISNHQLKSSENVVVYAVGYLQDLNSLLEETMATTQGNITLHNYMVWKLVRSFVPYLSAEFVKAYNAYNSVLSGVKGKVENWRMCITDTDSTIGFALGAMFVREAFHGGSKDTAEKMIGEVKDAFKKNLPFLSWMDNETRIAAKDKANAVIDMIGFPPYILEADKLDKRYENLEVFPDKYFQNNLNAVRYSLKRETDKLRNPPDKSKWEMTPPTVNAYYEPTRNEIVFPAGILQAPFYDKDYPKSLNFGGMGVVMGHELTHGFDDQGREYDKLGNLHPWWNNASITNFNKRTKCLVDQYSDFTVNGEHVNGLQTLGENIADNGGLKSAYHAYEDWLSDNGEEAPLPVYNLTHRQLFFVGFAQVWCSTSTQEQASKQLVSDPHSPGQFRVIGTLSNSKEFAEQYKCAKNARMNSSKKCEVW